MDIAAKFSDDMIVRLGFAPFMLVVGLLAVSNYRRVVEYVLFKRQGKAPSPWMVNIFRVGGSFWAIAAITLLIGIW